MKKELTTPEANSRELTEEELNKVSGGDWHCIDGPHPCPSQGTDGGGGDW